MIAKDIAAALGGTYQSGGWWRCRCPVHGSKGSTLAFRDGEHWLVVKCHAGRSRATKQSTNNGERGRPAANVI
jgi:hypothetical protein